MSTGLDAREANRGPICRYNCIQSVLILYYSRANRLVRTVVIMPSHELMYVFLVGDTPSPISIHPSIHPSGVSIYYCTVYMYQIFEYASIQVNDILP